MAFLRKLDGTRTYALRPRLTLIGRDAGCDIAVADNQISGRHAIVVNDSGRCFIAQECLALLAMTARLLRQAHP